MIRWRFTDPDTAEVYTFDRNPRAMTTPYPNRSTTPLVTTRDGLARALRRLAVPVEWRFSGDIRTQTHYEALVTWAAKDHRVQLRDHLDYTWDVLLLQCDITEARPNRRNAWRASYQMRALVYGIA